MDSEIKPISSVDPGELLLEAIKHSEHITPPLQNAIADFIAIWSKPVTYSERLKSKLFGKDIE